MTTAQRNKIIESINDCNRFIAKEDGRDANLRPAETAKLLEWYKSHREKLQNILDGKSSIASLIK